MGCPNSTGSNETLPTEHPYIVQFVLTLLAVILILMIVFGNVMVVIAVTTSRALRAPQNLFLVSLACADILLATLALDVLFCTSSIIHLCAISLDRYWSVSQAIEYNLYRSTDGTWPVLFPDDLNLQMSLPQALEHSPSTPEFFTGFLNPRETLYSFRIKQKRCTT